MTRLLTMTCIAALSTAAAQSAFAQETALSTGAATEQNDDLRTAIEDDFSTETQTFGNEGRQLGFDGSLALRASASDGNTNSVDIGLGVDLGYYDGTNGYGIELAYSYGETEGVVTEESLIYDFEYRRDLGTRFYGFAKVQGSLDEFSSFDNDVFVGLGAGYRIYDTSTIQWTVQAGPGYRVAELTDALNTEIEEGAFAVSSNYFHLLQPGTSVSVDTDIVASESDTVVYNSLALTQNVSNQLALRTSLNTEFHTDPVAGLEDTDNTLGVSLVYSFN